MWLPRAEKSLAVFGSKVSFAWWSAEQQQHACQHFTLGISERMDRRGRPQGVRSCQRMIVEPQPWSSVSCSAQPWAGQGAPCISTYSARRRQRGLGCMPSQALSMFDV